MSQREFFIVWAAPGEDRSYLQCLPTRAHVHQEHAEAEASRLAAKHPGRRFHVLRSIGDYIASTTVARQDHVPAPRDYIEGDHA